MRPRLVGRKRREHLLERQPARKTNGQRRHDVFDIMRAAQLRVRHAEDRRVLINDRSAFQAEIRLVRVRAEGNHPRRDFRQYLAGIDHRNVIRRLIFKNAQLRHAIFGDRAIAIEMVRGKIQPNADRRPEGPDGFELERAHFHGEHIEVVLLQRDFAKWLPDVAASNGALAARIQHLREQLCGGRLSVCAGNGDDRDVYRSPTQLELTHRLDISR